MSHSNCLRMFAVVLVSTALILSKSALARQLWIAPLDPQVRSFNNTKGADDYFKLFARDSPWSSADLHVSVFKIYPQLALRASNEELTTVIRGLRDRGIKLALEFGALTDTVSCGRGIEGYNGSALGTVAARIKSLGGQLDYLAMDEPLWYGAWYNGKGACHSSVAELAIDVASNLRALRAVYPQIIVGDIEPVFSDRDDQWIKDLTAWCSAFYAASGSRLAFIHADILWDKSWKSSLKVISANLAHEKVNMGVLCTAPFDVKSNERWAIAMERNCRDVKNEGINPEYIVVQSWDSYPNQVLPESEQYTFMNAVSSVVKMEADRSDSGTSKDPKRR